VEERDVQRFAAELTAAWQRAHPRAAAPPARLRDCAAEIALLLASRDAGDRRLAELLKRDLWPVVGERDAAGGAAFLAFATRLAAGEAPGAARPGAKRAAAHPRDPLAASAAPTRDAAR
jgi:hypothetical protein